MNTVSQEQIIGIEVSRDWLDIHWLPDGHRHRLPNTAEGHMQLIDMGSQLETIRCFEAAGGQKWQLWAALDVAGIEARQLPPAQIKTFAKSRGTRAKMDRIDAELIARFMAFRSGAGRTLPSQKLRFLRVLRRQRGQLVETRKRLLVQIKARQKQGSVNYLKKWTLLSTSFSTPGLPSWKAKIERLIATDGALAETPGHTLRSRDWTCSQNHADRSDTRTRSDFWGTGSGTHRSCPNCPRQWRTSWKARNRRRATSLAECDAQAALVASHHNPALKPFADRLRAAGKPHKFIVTAVARKLVTIVNALCKSRQYWVSAAL